MRKQGYEWIDIDCIESERPYIFKYITDRFGEDKTARVLSFGTFKSLNIIDGVVRYFRKKWEKENPNIDKSRNPYTVELAKNIKKVFGRSEEEARKEFPEVFHYYDGLSSVKTALSVHPAGMVISPVTLPDNYGVFRKDGEMCLMLDMENVHDYTGLAKYDLKIDRLYRNILAVIHRIAGNP